MQTGSTVLSSLMTLACAAALTACEEGDRGSGTIGGSLAGHSFAAVQTSFFYLYDEEVRFWVTDYPWSCREWLEDNGPWMQADDPETVVGVLFGSLYRYSLEPYGSYGTIDAGVYEVDTYDAEEPPVEGDRLTRVGVTFYHGEGTIDGMADASEGRMVLETVDLATEITATFDLTLYDQGAFSGSLRLVRCGEEPSQADCFAPDPTDKAGVKSITPCGVR